MIDMEQSLPPASVPVETSLGVSKVDVFKRQRFRLPSFEVIADIICGADTIALLGASTLERLPVIQTALSGTTDHDHLIANILGGCVALGFLSSNRGYSIAVLKNFKSQLLRIAGAIGIGGAIVCLSLIGLHHAMREVYVGTFRWMLLSGVILVASRSVITQLVRKLASKGLLAKRIALVGVSDESERFTARIAKDPDSYRVVAVYDDVETHAHASQENTTWHGGVDQILADSQQYSYDAVVITKSFYDAEDVNRICRLVYPVVADIYASGNLRFAAKSKDDLTEIGGNLVILLQKKPIKDWQIFYKAVFDKVLGGVGLICLSPLMLLIAVIIRLDSKGPALFHQPRVGYNNLLFSVYKFRTMYDHLADHRADRQTTEDDPRITRVGRFLRKYSIDELPQLFNVMKGNMSLVGPRPHAPGTKADGQLFQEVVPNYALRHRIKPGITGLAQVNGYRGQTKTVGDIQRRVDYDLHYINTWSIISDFKIIILTILREIKSKNAF